MPDAPPAARRTTKTRKPMDPADPAEFFLHVYGQMSGSMGPGVFADSHIRAIGNPANGAKLYGAYRRSVLDANAALESGELD